MLFLRGVVEIHITPRKQRDSVAPQAHYFTFRQETKPRAKIHQNENKPKFKIQKVSPLLLWAIIYGRVTCTNHYSEWQRVVLRGSNITPPRTLYWLQERGAPLGQLTATKKQPQGLSRRSTLKIRGRKEGYHPVSTNFAPKQITTDFKHTFRVPENI